MKVSASTCARVEACYPNSEAGEARCCLLSNQVLIALGPKHQPAVYGSIACGGVGSPRPTLKKPGSVRGVDVAAPLSGMPARRLRLLVTLAATIFREHAVA